MTAAAAAARRPAVRVEGWQGPRTGPGRPRPQQKQFAVAKKHATLAKFGSEIPPAPPRLRSIRPSLPSVRESEELAAAWATSSCAAHIADEDDEEADSSNDEHDGGAAGDEQPKPAVANILLRYGVRQGSAGLAVSQLAPLFPASSCASGPWAKTGTKATSNDDQGVAEAAAGSGGRDRPSTLLEVVGSMSLADASDDESSSSSSSSEASCPQDPED
mmetsp:Transcript_43305/g.99816  ORF Transcript_43305/g.99816 Transcript_43305/m.99816 type:complete len:217 (+) Transcript_43305:143-793(+)